jgi:uncharacterized protein (TIGR03546 family)
MKFLTSIWTSFKSTVRGFDSPKQLALGVALGMVIGLIPKDSLIPYAIILIAILTTANLLSLVVTTILCSWVGPLLDPFTHQIGIWVLTFDPLESTWAQLYHVPLVAWTRFENTVVMGSVCLGTALSIPVYFSSRYCFEKFGSSIYELFCQSRFARWIVGEPATQLQKS